MTRRETLAIVLVLGALAFIVGLALDSIYWGNLP
jgi:hypothetical protein